MKRRTPSITYSAAQPTETHRGKYCPGDRTRVGGDVWVDMPTEMAVTGVVASCCPTRYLAFITWRAITIGNHDGCISKWHHEIKKKPRNRKSICRHSRESCTIMPGKSVLKFCHHSNNQAPPQVVRRLQHSRPMSSVAGSIELLARANCGHRASPVAARIAGNRGSALSQSYSSQFQSRHIGRSGAEMARHGVRQIAAL